MPLCPPPCVRPWKREYQKGREREKVAIRIRERERDKMNKYEPERKNSWLIYTRYSKYSFYMLPIATSLILLIARQYVFTQKARDEGTTACSTKDPWVVNKK